MFLQEKADFACNFFEKVLKHTGDQEWYGKPFLLAPWQEDALAAIFGNVDEEGRRAIEQVYLEIPKKSGKSEFAAGLLLLLFFLEATPGAQIYGAASATRQALNVYRAATQMVDQSPLLRKRFRILRGTNRILKYSDPESFYAAIAGDGDISDGCNPLATVVDEAHRWRTRKHLENWDVLSNGGITRRQTLTIAITTAGVQNESPLAWKLHEKTERIAAGVVSDPKFYGRIYGADKADDPTSEATWIKANPSLKQRGGFLDIGKIRTKYESAVAEGDLTSFKRYFLNIWDQKENRAIEMAKWDASAGDWKAEGVVANPGPLIIRGKEYPRSVRPLPVEFQKRFVDRRCWVGVDLSMTTDLTAAAFLFPCKEPDTYDVLPFFWLPEEAVLPLERKLGVPLRKWAEQGFLELSPGNVIDYRDVRSRIDWGRQLFDLREVCVDPWNSRQMSVSMVEDGYNVVEIRQGYATLSEPTKKLLAFIVQGKLHHGGHPVLRWHAGCAATSTDGRDNLILTKPDRFQGSSRIDGMAALANAMTRALLDQTPSFTKLRSV